MGYKIKVTVHAQADLDAIIEYIVMELKNASAAVHLLDKIEKLYSALESSPRIYSLCQQKLLSRRGFRKVSVGGYVLIYKVDEQQQTIYIERFFSALEDYEAKI